MMSDTLFLYLVSFYALVVFVSGVLSLLAAKDAYQDRGWIRFWFFGLIGLACTLPIAVGAVANFHW